MTSKTSLIVILTYLVLSLVATYPLVFHFNSAVPGTDLYEGAQDAPLFGWNYWWTKYSLIDLKTNPFATDFILYPQKINLLYHTNTFTLGLLSIPLQYFLPLPTINNLFFLLSLTFSGFGLYWLTRYSGADQKSSFIAGLIFAFSSFVMQQAYLGHPNLYMTAFIPYAIYFFIKGFKEKSWQAAAGGGLFFALAFLNSLNIGYFLALFFAVLLIYFIFVYKKEFIARLKYIFLYFGVFFVLSAIVLIPLLTDYRQNKTLLQGPYGGNEELTIYRPYFFKLSYLSTWENKIPEVSKILYIERDYPLGFIVLILLIIGLSILIIKKISASENKSRPPSPWFWLASAVIFYFLGFGFYPFFKYIPLYSMARVAPRFHLITILSLAVFSAQILTIIFNHRIIRKKSSILNLLFLVVALFVFLESLCIPLKLYPLTTKPGPVYDLVRNDPADFTLLEIPFGLRDGFFGYGHPLGDLQYLQTYHHKKILNGAVSRLTTEQKDYYKKIPGLAFLAEPEIHAPDQNDLNESLVRENLKNLKIKYIILHLNYPTYYNYKYVKLPENTYRVKVKEYLENVLLLKPFYQDNKLLAYKLE